ncbi:uncharacterized protein [Onthophagus taurus]|uniref:uncharacterized protein isoform X2 n=1 Tax=Onthophagus taurus TaxID=166361 RepID=UPI0039BDD963
MGNVFFTRNSRKTICKVLNRFPNWMFQSDHRVYLNPLLLEWRKNELNDEFFDSAFELSLEEEKFSPERKLRRQTICGYKLSHKEEMKILNDELAALRKQVELLISREIVDVKEIPPPPPLPNLATSTPHKGPYKDINKDLNKDRYKDPYEDFSNKNLDVLKDITNVKLKPVIPKKMGTPRKPDVRNDLHEILKRRYAAMHSPQKSLKFDEDENYISCSTQNVLF